MTDVVMPKLGLEMVEGEIVKWFKKEGERVEKDEPLLIVETEKITFEVPSPASGVLSKIFAKEGKIVPVAQVIATIAGPREEIVLEAPKEEAVKVEVIVEERAEPRVIEKPVVAKKRIEVSPRARKLAEEHGVNLSMIEGTGPGGRIVEKDVLTFIEAVGKELEARRVTETITLKGMRRTTAERMLKSWSTAPQVTLVMEVDVSEAQKFRERLLAEVERTKGVRLTFTDMIVKAVARALREHPSLNSTLVGDEIKIFDNINIGVAVSVEGGLIVPVVQDADKKSLVEISRIVNDLIERAKRGKLSYNDVRGGTFTVSSMGMFGIDTFSPIVNPPECAILGVGRIVEKATIINGKVEVRPVMSLCLSFDHRIVDGVPAARFLQRIKGLLENPFSEFTDEISKLGMEVAKPEKFDWDVAVIGGGPGGYSAAIKAAQFGGRVLLMEKDEIGGTCLNKGCIPTKTLLSGVELLTAIENAKDFGVHVKGASIEFKQLMERKDSVVGMLKNGLTSLIRNNGIQIIKGIATIEDPHTILVKLDRKEERVKAKSIIIATGSVPAKMRNVKFDEQGVLTSEKALTLDEAPKSLIILGGDNVAVEFATMFRRLGTEVTVVSETRILPAEDREIARLLQRSLEKSGIGVLEAKVERIKDEEEKVVVVEYEGAEKEFKAEKILLAAGRVPHTDGLGIKELGVKVDDNGRVLVNERMETNIPNIYAVGDVIGGTTAHFAIAGGIVAAKNAMGEKAVLDSKAIPHCTYSTPEVAHVGLTEENAKTLGHTVKVGRFPFSACGRALTMGKADGIVKVISDASTGKVLGIHIIGPRATDLISEGVVALKFNASVDDFESIIHAHPTLPEAVMEAILDAGHKAIHIHRR